MEQRNDRSLSIGLSAPTKRSVHVADALVGVRTDLQVLPGSSGEVHLTKPGDQDDKADQTPAMKKAQLIKMLSAMVGEDIAAISSKFGWHAYMTTRGHHGP